MMQKKLKIGIIGSGSRGIYAFGMMIGRRDDVEVRALVDVNEARMRKAAGLLGIEGVPCYTELDRMFEGEGVDGVIVTTPDYQHEAAAVGAIAHGVPVLVDKPLAITSRGCLNIIEAARQHKVQVMVGFNLRHVPILGTVKGLIDDGEIGRVMTLENREFYDGGRSYMSRWNRKYEWSGGLWVHKGSHDFDVLNWFNPEGAPTRVASFAGLNALRPEGLPFEPDPEKPVGPNCGRCAYAEVCPDCRKATKVLFDEETAAEDGYYNDLCMFLSDKDTHDNGITIVEYDNNVRASHLENFVANFSDRRYTVAGDRGVITASLADPRTVTLRKRWKRGQTVTVDVPPPPAGGHGGSDPDLFDKFLTSIRTGKTGLATLRDGIRAVAVGEAAELSWREHRMVEISELVDLGLPEITGA